MHPVIQQADHAATRHNHRNLRLIMRTLLLAAIVAACSCPASAQNSFMTPGGATVPGTVPLCMNGGLASPCGPASPTYTVFAAGEFHVGEFGNNQNTLLASPAVVGGAYAAGTSIGGLLTLNGAARINNSATGNPGVSGNVLSTVLTFQTAIGTIPMDVYYFDANPANPCTDSISALFVLNTNDRTKVIGVVHVTDWIGGGAAIGQAIGPPLPYSLNNSGTIYACVITRALTPAIAAASGVSLKTQVLRQ